MIFGKDSDFSQGIVNRIRLAEWDNRGISRHGVSLLSGRFWQALTPAAIRRLHSTVVTLNSGIAPAQH